MLCAISSQRAANIATTVSQHTVCTTSASGHVVCLEHSVISYIVPNHRCFSGVRRSSLLQHVSRRLGKLARACALRRGTFGRSSPSPFGWSSPTGIGPTSASGTAASRSCVSLTRPPSSSFLRHRRLAAAAAAVVLQSLLSRC